MLKHLFLSSLRSFINHKSTFAINLLSLTIGLVCTIFIFMWINDELQVDKFHKKDAQLFQVMKHSKYSEGISTKVHTPGPLAEAMKNTIPEVEEAATIVYWFDNLDLAVGETSLTQRGYYAGKDFFQLFSFDLAGANEADVLSAPNNIAISRETAIKLFGSESQALGKMLELNREESFKVAGLFTVPKHSTQQFDFVVSFEKFKQDPRFTERMASWESHGPKTIISLQKNTNITAVEQKINTLVNENAEADHITFFLKPFSENYLYGRYEEGKLTGGRIDYVYLFGIIGLFILGIACINFINLTTARASLRAKEIGIKKTMGASRSSLVIQYLFESSFIAFLGLCIAIGIVFIFLPDFNSLTNKSIQLSFSLQLILASLSLVLITSLLAGIYPAFYLSAIQPISAMKGFLPSSWQELFIRKGLVVFQFSISVILILTVLIISQQMSFMQNKNLGYDRSQLVEFLLNIPERDKIDAFVTEARKLPSISNIASGNSPINHRNRTTNVMWEGKNPEDQISFYHFVAGEGLIETLGLEFVAGRSFSAEFGNETHKVIFNENAIATMGLDEPIGKVINLGSAESRMEIIGVVKDFHFQSLHEGIEPIMLLYASQQIPMLTARIKKGKTQEAIQDLQEVYAKFNPGVAFNYKFTDKSYNDLYQAEQQVATLSQLFSGFAILISCLGLLGLISFTANQKRKEIGVRKVLGASVTNIVTLLSKDFIQLVLVALLIAIPLAWYFMQKWLNGFAYHIELQAGVFFIAAGLTISIALLTMSFESVKAALANPADAVRE